MVTRKTSKMGRRNATRGLARGRAACQGPIFEPLEARCYLAAGGPAELVNGLLTVHGTDAADVIRINPGARGSVSFTVNGVLSRFAGPVKKVEVFGYNGNDDIAMAAAGVLPMTARWGSGDDTIRGGAGRDLLYGGPGNDILEGGDECLGTFCRNAVPSKAQFLSRNLGGDTIYGEEGNDTIRGGNEFVWTYDTPFIIRGLTTYTARMTGVPGDVIRGGSGTDQIFAGGGDDEVFGEDGPDTIYGDAGDDLIEGGNEYMGTYSSLQEIAQAIMAGAGKGDTIYGGEGNDVIRGGDEWAWLVTPARFGRRGLLYYNSGIPGDRIYGGAGNDTIVGQGGEDRIQGQDGNDTITGGPGNDNLDGGAGDDSIYGNDGDDQIFGGDGNDALRGDAGEDRIWGGNGNDIIWGGPGNDPTLGGGAGDDLIFGNDGADSIYGHEGNDTLYGNDGVDIIRGGEGQDRIFGGEGNDILYGEAGDDSLWGEGGDDELRGAEGADSLYGGDGCDRLFGDAGNDRLWGEAGADRLMGGADDDELHGGAGMDALFALLGHDTAIESGNESDRIYVDTASNAADYWYGPDAVFLMLNGTGVWSEQELEWLDDGIRLMHEANGLDTTIQPTNTGPVTFVRDADGTAAGTNSEGVIHIYNQGARSSGLGGVGIHELAHNWDNGRNPAWSAFLAESGWTQDNHDNQAGWRRSGDGQWWYRSDAQFAGDYGRTSPREDWATCVAAYFIPNSLCGGSTLPADKAALVEQFAHMAPLA